MTWILASDWFAGAGGGRGLGDVFVFSGLGKQILVSEIPLMGN